jgi:hypothetical protein
LAKKESVSFTAPRFISVNGVNYTYQNVVVNFNGTTTYTIEPIFQLLTINGNLNIFVGDTNGDALVANRGFNPYATTAPAPFQFLTIRATYRPTSGLDILSDPINIFAATNDKCTPRYRLYWLNKYGSSFDSLPFNNRTIQSIQVSNRKRINQSRFAFNCTTLATASNPYTFERKEFSREVEKSFELNSDYLTPLEAELLAFAYQSPMLYLLTPEGDFLPVLTDETNYTIEDEFSEDLIEVKIRVKLANRPKAILQ